MVTIISGTNRPGSWTLKLAKYYQKRLAEKGMETTLFSLDRLPPRIIETDLFGKRSPEFEPIQQLVTDTQKFLFIIPEYNGSFPGVLKTFSMLPGSVRGRALWHANSSTACRVSVGQRTKLRRGLKTVRGPETLRTPLTRSPRRRSPVMLGTTAKQRERCWRCAVVADFGTYTPYL